jgi:hypothetical protein
LAASAAIRSFITILSALPAAVIDPARIEQSGPTTAADLPRIAVSLAQVKEGGIGIGGVVGLQFDGAQWITSAGARTSGLLQLEIWAAGVPDVTQISDAVLDLLASSSGTLVTGGFVRFETEAIRPAEAVLLSDSSAAMHRMLHFSVVHEDIATLAIGPGGTIQEIDVEINGQLNQKLTVR